MSIVKIGDKYARLTVVSSIPKEERLGGADARRRAQYLCMCDCGNKIIVAQANLVSGRTESCGCLRRESLSQSVTTHGLTKRLPSGDQPRLYHIWRSMKQRCYNKSNTNYRKYGERGISVCEEWKHSFEAFHSWAISNGYRDDLSLDRIDNDGAYCPENCRWATPTEQSSNTRRSHKILYDGKTFTITGLAKHLSTTTYQIQKMLLNGTLKEQ